MLASLLLFALGLAPLARAEDPVEPVPAPEVDPMEQARVLHDTGTQRFAEGDYAGAAAAWEEGYRLSARPGFLLNIASAHERAGDLRATLDTLERYRPLARPEEQEALARRMASLEARVAPPPPPPPPVPAPAPEPVPLVEQLPPPLSEVAPTRSGRRIGGGVLLATGLVGFAGGVAFDVAGRRQVAEATALCRSTGAAWLCPRDAEAHLARAERQQGATFAAIGLGAALSSTGLVLIFTEPRHPPAE
jgi:hypothetical protein